METVKKSILIPSDKKKVFKQYLTLTRPLNGLRPMEIEVVALLLYYYIEEYDNFKRDEDRWRKVFSYETKLLVRKELNI